jgi:hypothetical protein
MPLGALFRVRPVRRLTAAFLVRRPTVDRYADRCISVAGPRSQATIEFADDVAAREFDQRWSTAP